MKNILLYKLSVTGVNFLISLFVGILIPRVVGPVSYGNYSYIISTFAFVIQILMLSSNAAYVYFLSNAKFNVKAINSFYSIYVMIITLLVMIFSFITINTNTGMNYLWNNIFDKKLLYLGMVFGILINFQDILISFSDSTRLTIRAEKIKILSKIIMLMLICILLLYSLLNIFSYLLILIVQLLVFIVLFFKFLDIKTIHINKILFKEIFKDFYVYLKPLIFFTILASIYSFLGKYVMQTTSGSKEQGFFNFAYQLALMPVIFITSLMVIYMSEMTKYFKKNNIKAVKNIFIKSIYKIYAIHSFFAFFILINAKEVILFTVGEEYLGALYALRLLTLFSLLHTFGTFSRSIFYSSGRTKQYSLINSITMVIGIVYLIYVYFTSFLDAKHLATILTILYSIRVSIQIFNNLIYLNIKIYSFLRELGIVTMLIILSLYIIHNIIPSLVLNLFFSLFLMTVLNFIFKDFLEVNKIFGKRK